MTGLAFNGTQQEAYELVEILNRNCACKFLLGIRQGPECAAHSILKNQRILDGLVFMRRKVECLLRGEIST